MKGKKITAMVLSLAMVVGVPAAVLADEPEETAEEQVVVEETEADAEADAADETSEETEASEETEVTEVTESTESTETPAHENIEQVAEISAVSTKSYNENTNYHGDITWTYEDDGKTAILKGNGPMPDLTTSYSDSVIEKVIIEYGITRVGTWSFYDHYALKVIDIPRSVTSIGNDVIYGCSSLKRINLYSNPKELTWDSLSQGKLRDSIKEVHVSADFLEDYKTLFPNSADKFVGDLDTYYTISTVKVDGGKLTVQPYAQQSNFIRVYYSTVGNYVITGIDVADELGTLYTAAYHYETDCYGFIMPNRDVTITPYFEGDMDLVEVPVDAEWSFVDWPDDASIEVTIVADGTPLNTKITLTKENHSSAFTDLPKYSGAEEINYTVTAEGKGPGEYNSIITGDMTDGYHIKGSQIGVVAENVSYIDQNGTSKTHDAVILTGFEKSIAPGWYVVKDDIDYTKTMSLNGKGDFYFILSDGKTMSAGTPEKALNISKVIYSDDSSSNMIVFGQKYGSGAMKLCSNSDSMNATVRLNGGLQWYGGNLEVRGKDVGLFYSGAGFKMYGGSVDVAANSLGVCGNNNFYFYGGQFSAASSSGKDGLLLDSLAEVKSHLYIDSTESTDSFYVSKISSHAGNKNVNFCYEYRDEDGTHYFGEVNMDSINGKKLTPVKNLVNTWDKLKAIIEGGDYDSFSLHNNIIAGPTGDPSAITIDESKSFVLNLNGYTIITNNGYFDVKGNFTVNGSGTFSAYRPEKVFNIASADASLTLNSVACTSYDDQLTFIRSTNGAKVTLDGAVDFEMPVYLGKDTVLTIADGFCPVNPVKIDMEECGVFTSGLSKDPGIDAFVPVNSENCLFYSEDGEAQLSDGSFVAGYSATVDGAFQVNIHLILSKAVIDDPDAYIKCIFPKYSSNISLSQAEIKTVGNNKCYVFPVSVTAKEFYDNIKIELHYGDKTVDMDSFDIDSYLNQLGEEYKGLVDAMELYATSACYYFGYNCSMSNPDDAAHFNGAFMEYLLEKYNAIDVSALRQSNDITNLPADVSYEGSSVICSSKTTMKLFFKSNDDITASIGGKPVDVAKLSGYQVVSIENVAPADLDQDITVTVNGSDIVVSPMAYCMQVINSEKTSANLKALAMGLVVYNYQANKIF